MIKSNTGYRLSLMLKCWGVGMLLIRIRAIGNEALASRKRYNKNFY